MKETDTCFYMNITKEENSAFILAHPNQEDSKPDRKLQQMGEQTSKVASVIASVGQCNCYIIFSWHENFTCPDKWFWMKDWWMFLNL